MTNELDSLLNREWDGKLSVEEAARLETLSRERSEFRERRELDSKLRASFRSWEGDAAPADLSTRVADRVLSGGLKRSGLGSEWRRSLTRAAVILVTLGVVGIASFQLGSNAKVSAGSSQKDRLRTEFLRSLTEQRNKLERDFGWSPRTIEQIDAIRLRFWELDYQMRQDGASGEELQDLHRDEQGEVLRALTPHQREIWRRRLKKTRQEIEKLIQRAPR